MGRYINYIHGKTGTRIYGIWSAMIDRCKSNTRYIKRGISVCEKWKKFSGFYEDMKEGYDDGLTIDRINNDKGYFKENCRWVSMAVQAWNRGNTVMITIDGVTKPLKDWMSVATVSAHTIRCRIYYGWPHKEAVLFPKGIGREFNGALLTREKVIIIKKLLAEGKLSQQKIAERVGASRSAILNIKLEKTWKYITI